MLTKPEAIRQLRSLLVELEKYDPNQPRDEIGRWTVVGGSSSGSAQWENTLSFNIPTGAKVVPQSSEKPLLVSSVRTSKHIFTMATPGEQVLVTVHPPETADEQRMAKEYKAALTTVPEEFRAEAEALPFGFVDSRLFTVSDSSAQYDKIEEAQPFFVAVYGVSNDGSGPPQSMAMDPYAMAIEMRMLPKELAADFASSVAKHELGHFLDNKLGQRLFDQTKAEGKIPAALADNATVRQQSMYSEVHSKFSDAFSTAIHMDDIQLSFRYGNQVHRTIGTFQNRPEAFADAVAYLKGAKVIRGLPASLWGQMFPTITDTAREALEHEGITFPRTALSAGVPVQKSNDEHDFSASLQPYTAETRRTLPDGTVRVDIARRGPMGFSDGVRYERPDGSVIRKYDPDQPRDESGKWSDTGSSLSEQEITEGLKTYAGEDPYKNAIPINGKLRTGEALSEAEARTYAAVVEAFARAKPLEKPLVVYRGTGVPVKLGDVSPHPISTSHHISVGDEFSTMTGGKDPTVYRIVIPKGTRVVDMEPYAGRGMEYQKEVLLPPGGRLQYQKARRHFDYDLKTWVHRVEFVPPETIAKYDPDQPRHPSGSDEGGQWSDGGSSSASGDKAGEGTTSGVAASGSRRTDTKNRQLMHEITSMSIPDRKKQFEGEGAEGRRRLEELADPENSIGRIMKTHIDNAGDWSEDEHENFSVAVAGRIGRWVKDGVFAEDVGKALERFSVDLHNDLTAAGSDKATALRLARHATDIIAAQEVESLGRTLGDHGIRHITQDVTVALDVLKVLPGSHENDPAQRAAIRIAAAFHDAGYMAPPARVFLDKYHPEWGEKYYNAHVRSDVNRALGSENAALAQRVIRTHADTDFDWQKEPVESAFRIGDNLALFQQEKLPGLLRYAPANVKVAEELGRGTITHLEARRQAAANVEAAGLSPRLTRTLKKAASELSPIFPKFTLGMFGGRYEGVQWTGGALQVNLRRASAESAFLRRITDLHSRQFVKFAESYLGENHPALKDAKVGRGFSIKSKRSGSRMHVAFLGTQVTKMLDTITALFDRLR